MSQKWNLQDIRPAQPRKRRTVNQPSTEQAQKQSTQSEQESPINEHKNIPNVVIED